MTLDKLFMQNNKPVVRISVTCSSLYGKIFDNLTNEEFSQNLWDLMLLKTRQLLIKRSSKKFGMLA